MPFALREKQALMFDIRMASTIAAITPTIRNCEGFMKSHCAGDTLGTAVVLRELLGNAVNHGNRGIAESTVNVTIAYLGERQFRLQVEDQGSGFNVSDVDMSLPEDPRWMRKRGYVLINSLSDRIEFNGTGNRVAVFVTLPEVNA